MLMIVLKKYKDALLSEASIEDLKNYDFKNSKGFKRIRGTRAQAILKMDVAEEVLENKDLGLKIYDLGDLKI